VLHRSNLTNAEECRDTIELTSDGSNVPYGVCQKFQIPILDGQFDEIRFTLNNEEWFRATKSTPGPREKNGITCDVAETLDFAVTNNNNAGHTCIIQVLPSVHGTTFDPQIVLPPQG
jgi:hypothetical protein